MRTASGADVPAEALAWAAPLLQSGPVLVYSNAESFAVKVLQNQLELEEAGARGARIIAEIARGLVATGER